MTLEEFLEANADGNALVSLVNAGAEAPFATVSASAADSLDSTLKAKTVTLYTVKSPTSIIATLGA